MLSILAGWISLTSPAHDGSLAVGPCSTIVRRSLALDPSHAPESRQAGFGKESCPSATANIAAVRLA